jgi:hypothetical protein
VDGPGGRSAECDIVGNPGASLALRDGQQGKRRAMVGGREIGHVLPNTGETQTRTGGSIDLGTLGG